MKLKTHLIKSLNPNVSLSEYNKACFETFLYEKASVAVQKLI